MNRFLLILLLSLALSACGSPDTPTSSPTVQAELPTMAITLTPEPTPTAAAVPSPETPPPAEQVILLLKEASPDDLPVIDGVITDSEWQQAEITFLTDGSEVFWLYAGGYLFVGIQTDKIGAVNLALMRSPDQIWILHSSAALGSAIYQKQSDGWDLIQDFSWCCRSTNLFTERDHLFATEGWQANIGYQGTTGEVEYQVAVDGGQTLIALMYLLADGSGGILFWPETLEDTAVLQLQGPRNEIEHFTLENWSTVIFSRGE